MPGSTQEIWTIARILKKVAAYLAEKGFHAPRLDAEVLLSHILGLSRVELYTGHDRPLLPRELEQYRELVKRRAAGEPAAYIVGHKEFYSLDFEVGPGVLVPRPETEFLVLAALEEAKSRQGLMRAADIGTGSGCVAVSMAVYAENCEVAATDKSAEAAEYARKNARRHNVHERVSVAEGDLLEPLRKMNLAGKLDIIVSNPPYITDSEFDGLPVDVRDYEPREALVAGEDGTEYHERIVMESPEFLTADGLLALEVGAGQSERVVGLVVASGRFRDVRTMEDYGAVKRIVVARRG
jgi:release factor glutamine methyltransferase